MTDTIDPLLRDLLSWLGRDGRPYPDVMDAWRTSCPRLPVWEDANECGFVERMREGGATIVLVTPQGRAFLTGETGEPD